MAAGMPGLAQPLSRLVLSYAQCERTIPGMPPHCPTGLRRSQRTHALALALVTQLNGLPLHRTREKTNRPQTRRRRDNTDELIDKLRQLRDNLAGAKQILEEVVRRERRKRDLAVSRRHFLGGMQPLTATGMMQQGQGQGSNTAEQGQQGAGGEQAACLVVACNL